MKISIAMATYNGAQYIQEQLQSLLNQSRQPDELVVCDDGSTDQTLSNLEEFAKEAPFPVRIYRNEQNLGYSDNFLKAAKLCEGDWIAFCDQDDVWLPNKLQAVVDAIEQDSGLTMVLQNAELCDGQLNRRGRLFPNKIRPGTYGPNSQYGFWVWLGFLQTVRADLISGLDASERPPNYFPGHQWQSHDKWTCMIANALGGIAVLAEPVALYRRHEGALTGSYAGKTVRERVSESRKVGGEHYRFLADVAALSECYLERLATETIEESWRKSFKHSAEAFGRLSEIQTLRADLYEADGVVARVAQYFQIGSKGGYLGPKFVAMGWRSAVKDIARLSFGARISTRIV
ncbi:MULTISPECIES: glycosyltransferase family 2 protein [unclassified Marinobacter]|uniref:glycosyltransferase family 2 protein n=1 Tax=unclassified Marinobacter TaxID=83889 RepID=UPI0018F14A27|nr:MULTISPECIES: glycosyltransferase family 2 protein [unclassified Marinobacter]